NNHSTTLRALHNRFGLLTNDLVNKEIDAMMNDFVFDDMENWALTSSSPTVSRDNYKIENYEDGLNLFITYFDNVNFPYMAQQASNVLGLFFKDRKTITLAELIDYYATNN
ncbi:9063_t:CDS:2, partial [Cetraspora pellucida]